MATKNWKNVDWSRRSTDIATEFGTSIANVSVQRKRYAPDTLHTSYTGNAAGTEKGQLPLATLRSLNLDLCVNVGQETLALSRLKKEKGDVLVSFRLQDFREAWRKKGDAILTYNNNKQ